jgi:aminoglycoside 3-N-acetyltransferase
MASVNALIMPTFTFKTELIPEEGPENNGLEYGSGKDTNRMAEFFTPKMPADSLMGVMAETLRQMPNARRSSHPILSFSGINAASILQSQTLQDPLAPVGFLAEQDGWVLLLGVDHTVNTSIHLGEKLAGRRQFVRWALTPAGVKECAGYPGCSDGFQVISPYLDKVTRRVVIGQVVIQAIPVTSLLEVVQTLVAKDSQALLCSRPDCPRCNAVRMAQRLKPEN